MEDYKRRVRIEYKPFETHPELHKKPVGYVATVHDADTGEEIPNITQVIVYLRATGINEAAIIYHEQGEHNFAHSPHPKRAMSTNPELDVYAMERRSWLETVVFQALGEASLCWEERPRGRFQDQEAKRIGNELIAILEEQYLNKKTRPEHQQDVQPKYSVGDKVTCRAEGVTFSGVIEQYTSSSGTFVYHIDATMPGIGLIPLFVEEQEIIGNLYS